MTKEEVKDVVEQLPEREPLNFDDIQSTILKLKDYPNEIKQWMILVVLAIMATIVIITLVIIFWKIYHMRGTLGQMGEVLNIIKDKPKLSGLLEAGKVAQEKLYTTTPAGSSRRRTSQEPEVAVPLYQAMERNFPQKDK